jgi:hypothetical protein
MTWSSAVRPSFTFSDLVGSTAISAGLDGEDWRNLLSAPTSTQCGPRLAALPRVFTTFCRLKSSSTCGQLNVHCRLFNEDARQRMSPKSQTVW